MKKTLIISAIIVILLAVGIASAARTDFGTYVINNIYSGVGNGLATSTDNLILRPADTAHVVVVGATATSTTGNKLEVAGAGLFQGNLKSYGVVTGTNFVGTSTTATSSLLSALGVGTSTNLTAKLTVVDGTASTTFAFGSSHSGANPAILCMWNGENYSNLYFDPNSVEPVIATSTSCN